jgi:hypothetical protein
MKIIPRTIKVVCYVLMLLVLYGVVQIGRAAIIPYCNIAPIKSTIQLFTLFIIAGAIEVALVSIIAGCNVSLDKQKRIH